MEEHDTISLSSERLFSSEPRQGALAHYLYDRVKDLPLICPHGHVDPRLFADPACSFGSPVDLFIIPDHYVFRMLYSQGIRLEQLGIPARGGAAVEGDHRKIWQIFGEHYHLFRATPSGMWINHALGEVFGVRQKLNGKTAPAVYEQVAACLARPEFSPRRLYERFNIEVLCTTDAAADRLEAHAAIRASGWKADIRPTFRPDGVVNLLLPEWRANLAQLEEVSGVDCSSFSGFVQALEARRAFFKKMGAAATDHGALTPFTCVLTANECERIYQGARAGRVDGGDAARFTGHMLVEMARMSAEDGLVMQLHTGSFRDHNPGLFEQFGRDKGADIPVASEFTANLRPLLERFGSDPRLRLILFTLDETTYARELAPLAGHYPALRLGPPWWFHDSPNGMRRYLEAVSETAGIYNLAGFNDDTRAFPSIPARHDVWRRVTADWAAGLVVQGRLDLDDGEAVVEDLAYNLAKRAYRLD